MIKKIFGHSFLYTLANHIPLVANIFILPIITPFLTREDYGIYGLTYAYIGGIQAFSMLGIDILFQNSFFKYKTTYKQLWAKYLSILLIWRVIYSLIIGFLLYFLFKSKINEDFFIYLGLVLVPILFFDLTRSIGTKYCQYEGKHQLVYISSFIASVLTLLTSFISIYYFRLGYLGFFIASAVAGLTQFIFYFYILHIKLRIIPDFNISRNFFKKLIKIGLPVIPHNYAGFLLESSDRILLDLSGITLNKIGGYNLAYNFSNYFGSFNLSMNSVLSPIYFKCFSLNDNKKANSLINSMTILWFCFLLVSCLLICIWSKEIFSLIYRNPEFENIYRYVPFIIVGMMYRPFYFISVVKSIYLEKTKSILKISIGGGLINLVANLIFVPFYGIKAALISTFVSYIYMGFSGFYIPSLKKNINFKYNPYLFIVIILMSLFLGIYIVDANFLIKTVLTVFIFFSSFIIYKYKLRIFIKELNNENLL